MYTCMYTYVYACMCTHPTWPRLGRSPYIHVYVHVYVYVCMHVYTPHLAQTRPIALSACAWRNAWHDCQCADERQVATCLGVGVGVYIYMRIYTCMHMCMPCQCADERQVATCHLLHALSSLDGASDRLSASWARSGSASKHHRLHVYPVPCTLYQRLHVCVATWQATTWRT